MYSTYVQSRSLAMNETINLKPLAELKLQIEKFKADSEMKLRELNEEYEKKIQELTDLNKERLERSGELYDPKNDLTLVPTYANRKVDARKLRMELPSVYAQISHVSSKDLCEYFNKDKLEEKMRKENEEKFNELATVSIEDAKSSLTKREMEDYWMERKIIKYDLDLKIK